MAGGLLDDFCIECLGVDHMHLVSFASAESEAAARKSSLRNKWTRPILYTYRLDDIAVSFEESFSLCGSQSARCWCVRL